MEEIQAELKEADLRRQVLNFEFLFRISSVIYLFFLFSLFFYKLSVWFLRKKKKKKRKKKRENPERIGGGEKKRK